MAWEINFVVGNVYPIFNWLWAPVVVTVILRRKHILFWCFNGFVVTQFGRFKAYWNVNTLLCLLTVELVVMVCTRLWCRKTLTWMQQTPLYALLEETEIMQDRKIVMQFKILKVGACVVWIHYHFHLQSVALCLELFIMELSPQYEWATPR